MDLNTKISDLTLGELLDLLQRLPGRTNAKTVCGLSGIAELFGVSLSTAKRLKASGILDRAISQRGHVILTDVNLALQLYHEATHGRKNTIKY